MARLTLTLLGGFRAHLDRDRAIALSVKKGQALLAYLAMPAGKVHLRDKLATLAPLQARCRLSLAALHQGQGRILDARAPLSRAIEMLDRMQMDYCLRNAEPLFAGIVRATTQ